MSSTIIYPGTFDPLTNGHRDLVLRALRIFDNIIVAIASSTSKQTCFDIEERIELANLALQDVENVEIIGFEGLLIDLAKACKSNVILRGLRAVSDFEYEFQLASMNRRLQPDIETVFLTPDDRFTYISSTLVREVARYGGDVAKFVHPAITDALHKKFDNQKRS